MTRTFKFRTLNALVAAGLLGAGSLAQAMSAPEVLAVMQDKGYHAVYRLERESGYWTAKAVSKDGERAYLLVNDANAELLALTRADLGTRLPSVAQVADRLRSMGYAHIREIEFDDGVWEVEVRQDRRAPKLELRLHPVTLEVLSQTGVGADGQIVQGATAGLSASAVYQALLTAGYRNVRDLEFDDGRWEADAINAAGQRVEVYVNAVTGAVEREKLDD